MTTIRYSIDGGLSKKHLNSMHKKALELLEDVGLEIKHEATLKILADHKGIKVNGTRVRYRPDVVEKQTRKVSFYKGGAFKKLSGGYAQNILDIDTGEVRKPTGKDLIEMTKLADSLGMSVISSVVPMDIPASVREIFMSKTVWQNAKNTLYGGVITTREQAEYIYRIHQVIGKPLGFDLWGISPLEVDAGKLEIIHHFQMDKWLNL